MQLTIGIITVIKYASIDMSIDMVSATDEYRQASQTVTVQAC